MKTRDRSNRKEAIAAALLLVAGVFVRVALSSPAAISGDSLRFLSQARDLTTGADSLVPGDAFSAVPPGYPLFIRMVGRVSPGFAFLRHVQMALSVLTLLLVWCAVRRWSARGALVALALVALNPWLARQQALVMSETLGAFLVAVTVLLWPGPGKSIGTPAAFAAGALAAGATLVTPAAAFVAVPALGVLAWQSRSRAAVSTAMAAGLFVVVAPWQAYVFENTGRVEPLLLRPLGSGRTGLQMWIRSWSTTPEDKSIWWSREARLALSDGLLGDGPERARLREALAEAPYSYAAYVPGSGYDEIFRAAALARRDGNPILFWVGLPLARSATLWLDYRSMIGVPADLRRAGRLLEASYWATHAAFWGTNLLMLGLYAWGAARALRSKDALLLAVAAGTVAYSLASAAGAKGEFRRNLTLEPALALLAGATLADGTRGEAGA